MKLILVDPKKELTENFERWFALLPNVEVVTGYFEEIENYECLINAGNSFGIFDGGVDLAIAKALPGVQSQVQRRILSEYAGEQPVGTSFISRTGAKEPYYIAHTPTMRVPENIAHTDNVYHAMRAALLAIKHHNQTAKHNVGDTHPKSMDFKGFRINNAVCMGLGTATGKVPYDKAAYQMALAYTSVAAPITEINWNEATKRHQAIRRFDMEPPRPEGF